jgi:hypothetical protein
MLLLPGTLPADRATLKALCAEFAAHADLAAVIGSTRVEPFTGSWGDAERLAAEPATGGRFAIATPLHAALGMTDLTPLDPMLIALDEAASLALCEAADEHMRRDGVRLTFADANTWHVTCEREINALTERPEWLIGEPLRPNLPRGQDARLVERWMNELQMLLFAHPVNAVRETRGVAAINLVWLWGFGSKLPVLLPIPQAGEGWGEGGGTRSKHGSRSASLTPNPSPASGRVEQNRTGAEQSHLTALRKGDVAAWQNAWRSRSHEILSAETIILGDTRPHLRLTPEPRSAMSTLSAFFKRKPTLADALATLQTRI